MTQQLEREKGIKQKMEKGEIKSPEDLAQRVKELVSDILDIQEKKNSGDLKAAQQALLDVFKISEMSLEQRQGLVHEVRKAREVKEQTGQEEEPEAAEEENSDSKNFYLDVFNLKGDAVKEAQVTEKDKRMLKQKLREEGDKKPMRDIARMEFTAGIMQKNLPELAKAKGFNIEMRMKGIMQSMREILKSGKDESSFSSNPEIATKTNSLYAAIDRNEEIPKNQKEAMKYFVEEITGVPYEATEKIAA